MVDESRTADRAPPRSSAAAIAARLDRLPASRLVWRMIVVLSLGGAFEYYDLFFTGYVAPGMVKAGLFARESLGPFGVLTDIGLNGIGTFVFATFAGLFVGALLLGSVADRYGRRTIFVLSMLWYSAANLALAFQTDGFGIDLWRFVGGIGLGVELVTIDTYIAELIPAGARGRAFALSSVITFSAVPLAALFAWLLVPYRLLGLDGWRYVVLIGSTGALAVLFLRRAIPESPRWLARRGRLAEADAIVSAIERAVERETGRPLPPVAPAAAADAVEAATPVRFAEIWAPAWRGRTIMLSVFQVFQAIGYYGFAAWVPTLLVSKGILVTKSLEYSFIIAVVNPLSPLIGLLVADRFERKWRICIAAACIGVFGLAFAQTTAAPAIIALGILLTLANNWLSFSFHNYQAELFPTRIRARAVGFVYSWSRLSAAFAGLAIDFLLHAGGVTSVFVFIAFAMVMVVVAIGGFGPRTRRRSLEDISGGHT